MIILLMKKEDKINQNQFFDLITSNELSWQSIIYDLLNRTIRSL